MSKHRTFSIVFGLATVLVLLIGAHWIYQVWDHRPLPVESSPEAARSLAYRSLHPDMRAEILDWQTASVEEYTANWDHLVY